jgi:hypothetical protein
MISALKGYNGAAALLPAKIVIMGRPDKPGDDDQERVIESST